MSEKEKRKKECSILRKIRWAKNLNQLDRLTDEAANIDDTEIFMNIILAIHHKANELRFC